MASSEGQVIECHTVDEFNEQMKKGIESQKLVVIDFTATWCGPCRVMAPLFVELARLKTDVIFLKVDVDELRSVSEDFAVEAMPTFVFVKDGTLIDRSVGALKRDDLKLLIDRHSAPVTAPATASA